MTIRHAVVAAGFLGAIVTSSQIRPWQIERSSRWTRLNPAELTAAAECAAKATVVVVAEPDTTGAVAISLSESTRETSRGTVAPELPFDPGPEFRVRARWSTLTFGDGWLVARDKGEWGGGVWWFPPLGSPQVLIADRNAWTLGRVNDDAFVIASQGLDFDEGSELITLRRNGSGRWVQTARQPFQGFPLALHKAGVSEHYLLTDSALVLWSGAELRVLVSELPSLLELGPFSIAADGTSVYVGMALLWFHVSKQGGTPEWFIPSNCKVFRHVEHAATRAGVPGTIRTCVCADQ